MTWYKQTLSSQLGYHIYSNRELPHSLLTWDKSFLLGPYFRSRGTLISYTISITFLHYIRFINVTLETLRNYHWGLWLHNNCVYDLSFVPLRAEWNPKFNTKSELTVNNKFAQVFTKELTDVSYWNLKFLFLCDSYEIVKHHNISSLGIQFFIFFEILYFPSQFQIHSYLLVQQTTPVSQVLCSLSILFQD